jgi:glycerate dehydrogenase
MGNKAVILEAGTVSRKDIDLTSIDKLTGGLTVYDFTPADRIIEYVGDHEMVLCNKTPFAADIIKSCPKLRYIGICATGYNNVDLKTAAELGITVTNVPGYATDAVAEMVFAFTLEFAKRTADYGNFTESGGWVKARSFAEFIYPTSELAGKTIGIIGYGAIGSRVAEIAHAFGMKVIAFSKTKKPCVKAEFVSLETLFAEADYVTLHCPLTEETERLVNRERLALCKPTAVIINTARGGVVDEPALAEALREGKIAGAGLDVLATEPQAADSVFFGINKPNEKKKLLISPHIAWAPLETRIRLLKTVEENLRQYLFGTPINIVN